MIEELTPVELQSLQDAGELWQLLDVREEWEIQTARVSGSINIPMNDVSRRVEELDKSQPLAVMCHGGGRSLRVAAFLDAGGFARIANVSGGIDAWAQTVDRSIPRY